MNRELLEYLKSRQETYKDLASRDSKLCDYYLGKSDGIKSVLVHLEKENRNVKYKKWTNQ